MGGDKLMKPSVFAPFWLAHCFVLGFILLPSVAGQTSMSTGAVASLNNLKNAAYCADTSVSANTITCTTAVGFTGYAAGQAVDVRLANSVTGATTIAVNGLAAQAVTYNGTNALTSATGLVAGGTYRLQYDGTRFVLQGIVTAPSSCPAGSANQIQYYVSAGVCGGDSDFTFDPATSIVMIGTTSLDGSTGDANIGRDLTVTRNLLVTGSAAFGDGTVAGEVKLQELTANGSEYFSWLGQDARTTTLRALIPSADPSAGQVMTFSAPSGVISTITWITPVVSGGALGTPSSGTATNITGLPAAGVTGTAAVGGANLTTAGAIPYVSSSGTLNQDQTAGGQLWWDITNHGLHIGDATASVAKLTVVGSSFPVVRGTRALPIGQPDQSAINDALYYHTAASVQNGTGPMYTFSIQGTSSPASPTIIGGFGAVRDGADNSGAINFLPNNAGTLTERFRIDHNGLFTIGGQTSSFPGFKRSSATVAFRLGDDSADASITLAGLTASAAAVVFSGLGAASGTPDSVCLNTNTIVRNAALTCTVSSENVKNRLSPIPGTVQDFMALRPLQFQYNDTPGRTRWGFGAQQVASVNPALADGWRADGQPWSLDQNAILALTVKAVQELTIEVDRLKR